MVFLALSASGGYCQVPSVLITRQGSVSIEEFGPYSFDRSSGSCTADGCSVQRSLANNYDSEVQSSKSGVAGRARRIYDNVNVNGLASGGYVADIYAKVPFGQQVVIKLPISAQVAWNNKVNNIDGSTQGTATLYNNSYSVYDGTACYVGADMAGSCSVSKVARIYGAAEGAPQVIGGDSYYPVGNVDMYGRASLVKFSGPNPDANFSVSLGQAQVFYRGNVLISLGVDAQVRLVNTELPELLSVKVADGETGALIPDVPITFSVVAPANGARFENGSTSIVINTSSGVSSAKFVLGSSTGTYVIKASCPAEICTSGVKEVLFTATAILESQVVELKKLSENETMTVGRPAINPIRVQAFNTLTSTGVPNMGVVFSLVSAPPGVDPGSMDLPSTLTNMFGVAKASFTLGAVEGNYIIKAACESCEANREVLFSITARNPVENEHSSVEGEKTAYVTAETQDGADGVLILFQNEYLRQVNGYKSISRDDYKIGAIVGDVLTFRVITLTNKFLAKDASWSGRGSGESITVQYAGAGEYLETVTVAGKSRSVNVTAISAPAGPNWQYWFGDVGRPPHQKAGVLWCAVKAFLWGPGGHNDVIDAERHAYWNACMTNTLSAQIAESAGNARERSTYEAGQRDLAEFRHNEIVMDLENNAVGRLIGATLPPMLPLTGIQVAVDAAASNGELTVLDDPDNWGRAGLLKFSR